jgi:hypothetical protein
MESPAQPGALPGAGGLISVYGFNLGLRDELLIADHFPLPLSLGDVTLLVNNQPVPCSPPGLAGVYQVNVVIPPGLAPGPQTLVLASAGFSSVPATIAVK